MATTQAEVNQLTSLFELFTLVSRPVPPFLLLLKQQRPYLLLAVLLLTHHILSVFLLPLSRGNTIHAFPPTSTPTV
jgi:hypothetical protein